MTFEEWNKEFFLPYANSIGIQRRPYKRAYWIMGGTHEFDEGNLNIMHCSYCKALVRYQGRKQNINYCYRCGAVMEGIKDGKIHKHR